MKLHRLLRIKITTRRTALALLLFPLATAGLSGLSEAEAQQAGLVGHTPPNFWTEPRIFHRPFEPDEQRLLTTARRSFKDPAPEGHVLSPNKAYWYALSDRRENTQEIVVFSEREEVVVLTVHQIGQGNAPVLNWVNEKILYGEIWHGRISGEVFLLDAESGRMLLHEKAIYGQIHFQQWKQGCEAFPESPSCQKPESFP